MNCSLKVLSVLVLATGACALPGRESPPPGWLATRIAELEAEPVANPPAMITRYEYRGQLVYYLPPRCCDIPSELYDTTGAVICGPDGGFTGKGDGRCPDFFTERKDEKLIWRDQRRPQSP